MERNLAVGLFHASASLGIAESAHEARAAMIASAGRPTTARTRMLAAENAIELSACQARFWPARRRSIDDHYAANPTSDGTDEELTALFAEAQAAKTFINETATRVVDRALGALGRRRLPERHAARAGLPRRSRRRLHAPARRQPGLRPSSAEVALGLEPALS